MLRLWIVCAVLLSLPVEAHQPRPRIAVVIDDLGYQLDSGRYLAALPYAITLSVIPDTPFAQAIAREARARQKELMLHIPMEPLHVKHWEEGLTTEMDQPALSEELKRMLGDFPDAQGINNHGGSKLTADITRMQWVMNILAQESLFFLDSRTTGDTVADLAAHHLDVAFAERDVFLDNIKTPAHIAQQFQTLRRVARTKGSALAIGHPYPETLASLGDELPRLVQEGFDIVFCSELAEIWLMPN